MAKQATIEGRTELISLRPGEVLRVAGITIRRKKNMLFEITVPDLVKIEVGLKKPAGTGNSC